MRTSELDGFAKIAAWRTNITDKRCWTAVLPKLYTIDLMLLDRGHIMVIPYRSHRILGP